MNDTQNLADPQVSAWTDAASEEGGRIQPITDSQFLSLGSAATGFVGLILPDSLHTLATDQVVAAVTTYAQNGGNVMLVYDFGALTLQNGVPVYPIPKSRLSSLAGVDYVLYDALRDKTTGLGPVRARRQTMRQLLVPPGKSMQYVAPTPAPAPVITAGASAKSTTPGLGLLNAAGVSNKTALFLPVSAQNPGGTQGFNPQPLHELAYSNSSTQPRNANGQRVVTVNFGSAFKSAPVNDVTQVTHSPTPTRQAAAAVATDPIDAYSGYLLGNLLYPAYVTQGSFGGATNLNQIALADSPQFGLVAGVNPVGLGKVLFVNLPLTYLKMRTDALPMHGFLHYFTRNLLNMAHLSAMPNGVAGITLDWHLDSMAAQKPTQSLMQLNVFNYPDTVFSMEMTAGPDTIALGDGLGWDVPHNTTAQQILQSMDAFGHSVGSHGGWIHDYYGLKVMETNQSSTTTGACANTVAKVDNFEQCLALNHQAVDSVIGHPSRGYSAPEGNNPTWAMTWLANQGVVATYFGGHTGLGATRQYRNGKLLNPTMWVFPVTPAGHYATFEEWQEFNVPKTEITQWYRDLIDFNIDQNTSRMVYAHPPGAYQWHGVLTALLAYAKTQHSAGKLNWYTMTRLADFMTNRLQVTWTQTRQANVMQFDASHPTSLKEMVWRLPKSRYPTMPVIVSGAATVDAQDPAYWLVKAGVGSSLRFTAKL